MAWRGCPAETAAAWASLQLRELDAGTQRTAATSDSDRIIQISNRSSRLETPSPGVTVVTVHAFGHGVPVGRAGSRGEKAKQIKIKCLAWPVRVRPKGRSPFLCQPVLRCAGSFCLLPAGLDSRGRVWAAGGRGESFALPLHPFAGRAARRAKERTSHKLPNKKNETLSISLI